MKTPIHQNLSTSFVNLTALVRHLRELQFTGSVKLEYSSYEAEVIFTPSNKLQAREYDKLTGAVDQGESAFKRILARSREPFGRIHVVPVEDPAATKVWNRDEPTFVDQRIAATALAAMEVAIDRWVPNGVTPASSTLDDGAIMLATELLLTVKYAFTRTAMNFEELFENACGFAAENRSFIDPRKGQLKFENDELRISEVISTRELFEGIVTALSHVLSNLRGNVQYAKLLVYTRHRLQLHLSSRHDLYSSLGLVAVADELLN